MSPQAREVSDPGGAHGSEERIERRRQEALLRTGALQTAILKSPNFASIATDALGVIQIFNVGAARMLGYEPDEVLNKRSFVDFCDKTELVERAASLCAEFGVTIAPGVETLVFKASRDIEDVSTRSSTSRSSNQGGCPFRSSRSRCSRCSESVRTWSSTWPRREG